MKKPAKKIPAAAGRPTRHEGERLSKNRTFRVRGQLDEELAHAAELSGRSVSEEIEHRLGWSFASHQMMMGALELTFGEETAKLLLVIGDEMRAAVRDASIKVNGKPRPEEWLENPVIFDAVVAAVDQVFDEHNPRGGIVPPSAPPAKDI